jgi:hypothetical protein
VDSERLGRAGHLADHLLAVRLGSERDRAAKQLSALPDRGEQPEPGDE